MRTVTQAALIAAFFVLQQGPSAPAADQRPNVLLIMCDDLNDYVAGFGGHPQAQTPSLERLARDGVSFTQAHCNAPICAPSRASMFTGIYPHHSGCYGFDKWDQYEVLRNSRTIMDHFRANGYHTLGTGKLMHHMKRSEWSQVGNQADYGPFAFDGEERVAHPDTPAPFNVIGTIDGSYGPLVNLEDRTFPDGKSYSWQTGGWNQNRRLRVTSQDDRDPTADELNETWAVEQIERLGRQRNGKPFFMGVGFLRPHTPLIVPQRFFDQFPVDSLELPLIKQDDADDTHSASARGNLDDSPEKRDQKPADIGSYYFQQLVASYPSQDEALRHFIQAYLACVAAVDEHIGKILDALDRSGLADNTIVIVTSDHGWGMGEKDYLYKNSLWQESTRIPLVVRMPGNAQGWTIEQPVSLIDVYPTLIDLCGLTGDTKKNEKGHELDGHSFAPYLRDADAKTWAGPPEVLTTLYKWNRVYDPADQSYSLRGKDWRYIRYRTGKEELYHTAVDGHEWDNLTDDPRYEDRLVDFRRRLAARLPEPGFVPPQAKPKQTAKAKPKLSDQEWKDQYFAKHPQADANQDGALSWPELKAYRSSRDRERNKK